MADNYLERKMEEYRSGKAAAPRRRLIPSGAAKPRLEVPLGEITVLIVGVDDALVMAFANAGATVRFCNADDEASSVGRKLAERSGARYFPFDEATTCEKIGAEVDFLIRRSAGAILLETVATGLKRCVELTADATTDGTAAPETLAVLFCTPLFSTAAAAVTVI